MELKNITLSAERDQIARARMKAQSEKTTLNAEFRRWLKRYVSQERRAERYTQLMRELKHVRAGRKFSREEMNER